MRSRLLILAVFAACTMLSRAQYKSALPGFRFEFPRDHFNHAEYQTEWWYYTGNLIAKNGHRFGFELTFFRQGVDRSAQQSETWDIHDLYLAHLALSDLDDEKFHHAERTNRSGPGLAGVDVAKKKIWNGNWKVEWQGEDMKLAAVDERFTLTLLLHPEKPPVIHGEDGVSQKAQGRGQASHYASYTRLRTTGSILEGTARNEVSGTAWMDHEFFTHQLDAAQVGWDWLSLQLNDSTELMLFHIRRKDGSIDPFSAGTYVDAAGHTTYLHTSDFTLAPSGEVWKSPVTSAQYPVSWHVEVPQLGLSLDISTQLKAQELSGKDPSSPNYWEGSISIRGRRGKYDITGVGYLEMTGYDRPVVLGSQ
jgi:predicted secreted hydrolase